mmetsp:Transcript_7708/g.17766  ORF Transcript_7708/g.17766 Transcript_7708/m.17766 type:complete len:292 (-) Transcript_7708:410-1285(-)
MPPPQGLGPTPYLSPPRQRGTPVPLNIVAPPQQQPRAGDSMPLTPPNPTRASLPLTPPSPPGRRWIGGLGQRQPSETSNSLPASATTTPSTVPSTPTPGPSIPPPPPPPPPAPSRSGPSRPPHPLSVISGGAKYSDVTRQPGRYVPHVVTVSLETAPIASLTPQRGQLTSVARGHQPRLGQLLEACPLDGAKASAVTCVKFSPSADFCLLGYGVREPLSTENGQDIPYHPVTALYRVRGGMTHVSTMLSSDDDVNIARFHPDSGYGFVYGTKQGRVRVLSPRPWNYYNSNS